MRAALRSCEAISFSFVWYKVPDAHLLKTLVFGIFLVRRELVVAQLLYSPLLESIICPHNDAATGALVDSEGGIVAWPDRLSCSKSASRSRGERWNDSRSGDGRPVLSAPSPAIVLVVSARGASNGAAGLLQVLRGVV